MTVYTLFVDQRWLEQNSAKIRQSTANPSNLGRDSNILEQWLDGFSDKAGGALIKVLAGSGELAFDRIIRETSAYYLLGVEPAEADRDGRPRELKVQVSGHGVTVRGRSWVVVPKK